jgi:hypothetical protein
MSLDVILYSVATVLDGIKTPRQLKKGYWQPSDKFFRGPGNPLANHLNNYSPKGKPFAVPELNNISKNNRQLSIKSFTFILKQEEKISIIRLSLEQPIQRTMPKVRNTKPAVQLAAHLKLVRRFLRNI